MTRPSAIPLSRPDATRFPVPRLRAPECEITRTRTRRPLLRSLDAYFRNRNTWVAKQLRRLSSTHGSDYAGSVAKHVLDLVVSVPVAVIVVILIVILATINKLVYPRQPAFFRQDRVGNAGRAIQVVKLRSMLQRCSPEGTRASSTRCTRVGGFLRRHYLDELPQFFQVWAGQLSLVGIRVLPVSVYAGLADVWSPERFEAWSQMYATVPLGLTGVQQVFRTRGKEDERRFHRDMFYARHASLGFDLYLLWRTLGSCDKEIHDEPNRR